MKYLIVLALFWHSRGLATDSWLCTEEASQRSGDGIYACGIGTGHNEAEARARALDGAAGEFKRICDLSDTCRDHAVTAEPKRTDCKKDGDQFKCYRGVLFTINQGVTKVTGSLDQFRPKAPVAVPALEQKKEAKKSAVTKRPKVYIAKGMSQDELIEMLGKPTHISEWSRGHKNLEFKAPKAICHQPYGDYNSCTVWVIDGIVSSYDEQWDVSNTDALEN